ncbi:MAG: dihydrofolate reductase [Bacteroidales bacterium]|nr:dihydrofolate reductase [Bacteroidales bacterium]
MQKNIIVAISDNNAIGRNNELLWHISADMKFFRRQTLGWPVIMGRKTFESIGRALPGRANIVISRGFTTGEDVEVVGSLQDAFAIAESTNLEKCFVMGGGQIYSQALAQADRLVVTHVHTVIEDADTFFPPIDPAQWQVSSRSELFTDDQTGWNFEFVEYVPCHPER